MSPDWAAYALSCQPAWLAHVYGDRDPQVVAQAHTYADFLEEWNR